jgi:NADH dehydrogenase
LQRYTQGVLEKMGVQVLCGTEAVAMDEDTITIKGPGGEDVIPTRTKIWAAGVRASPLAKMLAERTGADLDRAGRVSVLPDCTLPEHPEVFVIGDMASLVQGCGRLLWSPVHRSSRLPDVGVRPGFVHVLYLIGWGNRLGTLYAWLRSLTLSNNRGYRVITEQNAQHELTRGTQDAHVNDAGGRTQLANR